MNCWEFLNDIFRSQYVLYITDDHIKFVVNECFLPNISSNQLKLGKNVSKWRDFIASTVPFAQPEAWSSSITICSARGMEFLYYHLLSPRYGVPLLPVPFAHPAVWSSFTLLPFAHPAVWSSSITICSARSMEFLYYHLLSPRYGVHLLPFAQPAVCSSSITICSAHGMEFL